MSTGILVLAWLGVAALAVVGGAVHLLLNRVLRPLREIKSYADEILETGLAITRNLDGIDAAVQTRELTKPLPDLVHSAFGTRGAEWSA